RRSTSCRQDQTCIRDRQNPITYFRSPLDNRKCGCGCGMPIERGDLPPVGDGAPNNEVGASG
ncbi:hypothetical protein PV386_47420, partial [Streptomyces europaeiscabiei]|nr:hypothetical protein [Streptomyces europaeiscabiei]